MNMTAKSRGTRAAAQLMRSTTRPSQPLRICPSCLHTLRLQPSRHYSAASPAKTAESSEASAAYLASLPPITPTTKEYNIQTGIILSRPPLLTAPQSSFQKAFYQYQKRLNERLAMPFSRYFYFKEDTPALRDWKLKIRERAGTSAKDVGVYQAYGKEGWNDEIVLGDAEATKLGEVQTMIQTLVQDSEMRKEAAVGMGESRTEREVEQPYARETEADTSGDLKSLERKLERTLYLVVRKENGRWSFPSSRLIGRENLHMGAERTLVQTGGLNMNTWVVGHVPISHHVIKPWYDAEGKLTRAGEKIFYMKGRIMAGQADITDNMFGLQDFRWLTREELAQVVGRAYFSDVKNALAER